MNVYFQNPAVELHYSCHWRFNTDVTDNLAAHYNLFYLTKYNIVFWPLIITVTERSSYSLKIIVHFQFINFQACQPEHFQGS